MDLLLLLLFWVISGSLHWTLTEENVNTDCPYSEFFFWLYVPISRRVSAPTGQCSVKCVAAALTWLWLLVPPPNGELARRLSSVTSFQPPHPVSHPHTPGKSFEFGSFPFLLHYVFSCSLFQDKSTGALIHTAHYNFESSHFKLGRKKISSNISIKSYGRLLRSPSGWSHAMLPVPTREVEFLWRVGRGEWSGRVQWYDHLFISFHQSLPPYFGVTEWKFCPKNDRLMFTCSKSSWKHFIWYLILKKVGIFAAYLAISKPWTSSDKLRESLCEGDYWEQLV